VRIHAKAGAREAQPLDALCAGLWFIKEGERLRILVVFLGKW